MADNVAELIIKAYVLNFPAFPTSIIVTQATAADLNATVVQLTRANLNAQTYEIGCTALANGVAVVLVPGTPVQLSVASVPCKAVILRARPAAGGIPAVLPNTGAIYYGSDTVDIGVAYNGPWLAPGESVTIPVANVNLVYIDADTANDAVGWLAVIQ